MVLMPSCYGDQAVAPQGEQPQLSQPMTLTTLLSCQILSNTAPRSSLNTQLASGCSVLGWAATQRYSTETPGWLLPQGPFYSTLPATPVCPLPHCINAPFQVAAICSFFQARCCHTSSRKPSLACSAQQWQGQIMTRFKSQATHFPGWYLGRVRDSASDSSYMKSR